MILADKIMKLRKRAGWSQEDLAEKMNISRQSVSKWESAASIPDLNKIILLAELFGVTTDLLLKDNLDLEAPPKEDSDPGIIRLTIEEATSYITKKIESARIIGLGVTLSISSLLPLFFLLALSQADEPVVSEEVASGIGFASLYIIVAIAIRFFLKSKNLFTGVVDLEKSQFELSYGVEGIIKEKLREFQPYYTRRLSLSIGMLIVSVLPLIITGIFSSNDTAAMFMLVLMFVTVAAALYILIPTITEHNVYNFILSEGESHKKKL